MDYLITSPSTFENLSYFKIGCFLPWFSDHCPLLYTLEVHNGQHNDNKSNKDPRIKAPKQFMWKDDSKENFLTCLNSPEVKLKLDQSIEIDHSDPNLLVNYISDLLIDIAGMANIKYRSPAIFVDWFIYLFWPNIKYSKFQMLIIIDCFLCSLAAFL